jgi:hypothetical protein
MGEFKRQSSLLTHRVGGPRGAFGPEDIAIIATAYHAVLAELDLSDQEDAITLLIARRIIGLASEGERDADRLRAATLASIKGERLDEPDASPIR